MTESFKVAGGKWRVKTEFGDYELDIKEFSNWNGFAVEGPYSCRGRRIGYGTFPFNEILEMERIEG